MFLTEHLIAHPQLIVHPNWSPDRFLLFKRLSRLKWEHNRQIKRMEEYVGRGGGGEQRTKHTRWWLAITESNLYFLVILAPTTFVSPVYVDLLIKLAKFICICHSNHRIKRDSALFEDWNVELRIPWILRIYPSFNDLISESYKWV